MIAYRLLQPQEPPRLQDVPKPSPQAGQLLIKVGGCGLCHTDIAIMGKTKAQLDEWHALPPFTLGHEIAGWVADIGKGVVGFKTGEPVAVVPYGDAVDTVLLAGAERKTPVITSQT